MKDPDFIHTVYCSKKDYENLQAFCPFCQKLNIINRASDLKKFTPISREIITCEHCTEQFPVGNDAINEKYEYFLQDCYDLKTQKKYMFCIINLCQAYEAFFLKCVEIKLLWLPWRAHVFGKALEFYELQNGTENTRKRYTCYDIFNQYSDRLHKKLKDFGYKWLLNLFFDLYLNNKSFDSCTDINSYFDNIKNYAKVEPKDYKIRKECSGELQKLFLRLKETKINEIRNKVAHKDGFRPTLAEVEHYLKDTHEIIFGLKKELELEHEIMYTTISKTIISLENK